MSKTPADKAAVRALLRRKRAALDPAALGLPLAGRQGRRAKGPSQEQVDDLLHWARGTYQGLESGRVGDMPADRLEALGRLLRLTEHEWAMLWLVLRGEDPPFPLSDCAGREVPGEWLDALHAITAPAYLNDRAWNILAYNEALPALFPRGEVPRNTMRWMLLDDEARGNQSAGIVPVLTDWRERWAPMVVPQLRAAVAALPDDPTLARLEADVLADPVAGPVYDQFAAVYVHPDGAIRPLRHATLGPGWATLCTAEPMASPRAHLMIVSFYPGIERPARRKPLRSLSSPVCLTHRGQFFAAS